MISWLWNPLVKFPAFFLEIVTKRGIFYADVVVGISIAWKCPTRVLVDLQVRQQLRVLCVDPGGRWPRQQPVRQRIAVRHRWTATDLSVHVYFEQEMVSENIYFSSKISFPVETETIIYRCGRKRALLAALLLSGSACVALMFFRHEGMLSYYCYYYYFFWKFGVLNVDDNRAPFFGVHWHATNTFLGSLWRTEHISCNLFSFLIQREICEEQSTPWPACCRVLQ